MSKEIYHQLEFLKKVDITAAELAEWEKLGLMKSNGQIDSKIPFYSEQHVQEAIQIKDLLTMGYSLAEIRKIMKKIGLPKLERRQEADNEEDYLTVGELALQAHINNRTIKYWEERGLITPDRRTSGGFRLYSRHYVQICLLIKDLQNFGYSLEHIKLVADLFRQFIAIQNDRARTMDAEVAVRQLQAMEQNILELNEHMNMLRQGIERWDDLLKKKRKEIHQFKAEYTSHKGKKGKFTAPDSAE
jgi:DNA-binding transcriptional MerR regulator